MSADLAIDVFKTTVFFALYAVAPFLLVMLLVGLFMSLLQAVTGLQEQTLTFTPKLIAFAALTLLLAPWLLRAISEFTIADFNRMAALAH
ncbi:MAG TPA: flagellar biosynthetic protein FliQ [Opitutaceae bacterium]|jgi:flagellar biosynthetic protein FliQ|nr:flagellar biosynthetic protein FliQ [Opitutaceae bacterium]